MLAILLANLQQSELDQHLSIFRANIDNFLWAAIKLVKNEKNKKLGQCPIAEEWQGHRAVPRSASSLLFWEPPQTSRQKE